MQKHLFTCPFDSMASIGEVWSGNYGYKGMSFKTPPIVLDIGANVGAFAIWSWVQWNPAKIICYEPHPETFGYLKGNLLPFREIELNNFGIGDSKLTTLHVPERGVCSSLYPNIVDHEILSTVPVQIEEPDVLPPANIIKIDTEGSEAHIVEGLKHIPDYLAVEYHSDSLRVRVENALLGKMNLLDVELFGCGVGTLKYVKA